MLDETMTTGTPPTRRGERHRSCRGRSRAVVTLVVYRMTPTELRAHECFGECCAYLGDVTVPRQRFPRARPGDRITLVVE
jgi:hypothetical protein